MRAALCGAFLGEADYLLLDEPTNHLDSAGRQFDDALHTPQQLPIMAGDQQPALPPLQLLIQPGA
ncbi:ABC transporter ATP-binding protein, partial [Serratia marcescens]